MVYNIVSSNHVVNLNASALLGLLGHMVNPCYVTLDKGQTTSYRNNVRDIDLPPSNGPKRSSILLVHQPIETRYFANMFDTDPPHYGQQNEWNHLPHGNLSLFNYN